MKISHVINIFGSCKTCSFMTIFATTFILEAISNGTLPKTFSFNLVNRGVHCLLFVNEHNISQRATRFAHDSRTNISHWQLESIAFTRQLMEFYKVCVLVWLVVSRLVPFLNVLLASKCLSHRLRATLSLSLYFSLSLALDGYRSTVLFFPWFQVARYLAGVCNDSALCHSGRARAAMLPSKGGFPLTFRNVRDVNVFMKVAVVTQYLTISVRMIGTF